jgi:hypothetical protein
MIRMLIWKRYTVTKAREMEIGLLFNTCKKAEYRMTNAEY